MENAVIKEIISKVNCSLNYYEKDYVSVKRTPFTDKERCESFEQYIEARFNYECCQVPELLDAAIKVEGHLFQCKYLENPDTSRRKFTTACVILDPNLPEDLKEEILKIVGGTQIKFNNVKKKIKFTVE